MGQLLMLRHLLNHPPAQQHLSDELLAELVALDVAGVEWEADYPDPAQHLVLCSQCANNFAELATEYEDLLALSENPSPNAEPIGARVLAVMRVWGQLLEWRSRTLAGWQHWLPRLQRPALPTLHAEADTTARWQLLQQYVQHGLDLLVLTVYADRETAQTCRLYVQFTALQPLELHGMQVRLRLGTDWQTAVTDANGRAQFGPLAIVALADWELALEDKS